VCNARIVRCTCIDAYITWHEVITRDTEIQSHRDTFELMHLLTFDVLYCQRVQLFA